MWVDIPPFKDPVGKLRGRGRRRKRGKKRGKRGSRKKERGRGKKWKRKGERKIEQREGKTIEKEGVCAMGGGGIGMYVGCRQLMSLYCENQLKHMKRHIFVRRNCTAINSDIPKIVHGSVISCHGETTKLSVNEGKMEKEGGKRKKQGRQNE